MSTSDDDISKITNNLSNITRLHLKQEMHKSYMFCLIDLYWLVCLIRIFELMKIQKQFFRDIERWGRKQASITRKSSKF